MKSPVSSPVTRGRWASLWSVALLSFLIQLWLCQFFTFGQKVPMSIDINPSNLWKFAYHFPPTGSFEVLNWLGNASLPQPLNPFSLAAHLPPWWFFTLYAPVIATLSLLAMAAFLRELDCPRPAALFGAVIYAWQGDILTFVFPGHFGYIATWPFYAMAAWGALRAQRTRYWPYAIISGASCGIMVELQPDRGGIASLLIAVLYAAPLLSRLYKGQPVLDYLLNLRHLALCAGMALLIALASLLALFQSNIEGVKLGNNIDREETYNFVTQFSIGPAETLTYLVPGFFGWHISSQAGPYWGWIGQRPDWEKKHRNERNLNLAISTVGTVASVLSLIGICLLVPGRLLGPHRLTERQGLYGRTLLVVGLIGLVLAWGWHTPFYRPLLALPFMDKWRNPLKWLEMTNFALVALSAFGMQHFMASLEAMEPEEKITHRRLTWFSRGLTVLLGLGFLASYPASLALGPPLQAEGYAPSEFVNIMSTLHTSLFWAFLLMVGFSFLLYALGRPDWLRGFTLENPWLNRLWQKMLRPEWLGLTAALALGALSVAQLGWVATQFIQPTDLNMITQTNALLEALRSEGPRVRVSVATEDPVLNVLLLNQFNIDKISCMDISAASRIPDDIGAFFYGALTENETRIWFLAGVKNVAVPEGMVSDLLKQPAIAANVDHINGYMLIPTDPSTNLPSHALLTMRDYLAKATLVPHAEVIPAPKAMLQRMKDPAWNPRDSILLASPAPNLPAGPSDDAGSAAPDQIDLKTYTPTEIEIKVSSAQGGYVLINDHYDPDWRTQVNGRAVDVLRADFLMRAVPVPPGNSTITMHYVARYHLGSLTLSAEAMNNLSDAALLAAWVIAGFAIWRRRKAVNAEP